MTVSSGILVLRGVILVYTMGSFESHSDLTPGQDIRRESFLTLDILSGSHLEMVAHLVIRCG